MDESQPRKKKKQKGSPIIRLRVPSEILEAIQQKMESCNRTRKEEPYTLSSFVRAAIIERFQKYARAHAASAKKRGNSSPKTKVSIVLPSAEVIADTLTRSELSEFVETPLGRQLLINCQPNANGETPDRVPAQIAADDDAWELAKELFGTH